MQEPLQLSKNLNIDISDFNQIKTSVNNSGVDLVIVGPEIL